MVTMGVFPFQRKTHTVEPGNEPGTSWLLVRSSDHQATRLVRLKCKSSKIFARSCLQFFFNFTLGEGVSRPAPPPPLVAPMDSRASTSLWKLKLNNDKRLTKMTWARHAKQTSPTLIFPPRSSWSTQTKRFYRTTAFALTPVWRSSTGMVLAFE